MQILEIGNFGTAWDGSICDELHIAEELRFQGHSVIQWQREEIEGGGEMNWFSAGNGPDLVLIAQWDKYPYNLRELIDKTVGHKVPLVYWAFDYQDQNQEWHQRLIQESDLYLSKRLADSKYSNWQWLSQDFAPNCLGLDLHQEKDIDVLFTGSYLPWAEERNETLKAVDENFNLVIHSVNEWPGFKDVRPPVVDRGLVQLYQRAKVVLSIDHTLEAGYWSDRNAQIMCCGVRPLFRYVSMSEAVFRDKVDYFYGIKDCLDKIRYQLEMDPGDRQARASGSYLYAERNLKVGNRVNDLLTIVRSIL
jgi:hypothetical protein